MTRAQRLQALSAHTEFDLAIVGGGATGLGLALDAALRGFSVVLLESHDFAGGTSSRSTKLLHGGVRYLAQGNWALVREALAERATVLQIAPHLAQPLRFVMPSYRWWQTPFYGLGLKFYDFLAGSAGLGATRFLSRTDTEAALPGVQRQGLRGGVAYWDAQFDDARLALALALSAEAAGALLLNHAEVMDLRMAGRQAGVPGRPAGGELSVCDRISGESLGLRARCVVNATGVWVDQLRQRAWAGRATDQDPAAPAPVAPRRLVSPSQGVHLVVDRAFMPGTQALLVPKTPDGRVLFVVPWLGKLILGTTDTPRQDLPREPLAFEEELSFILCEASRALARPVKRSDVRSVWVGLRPLVAPSDDGTGKTKALSREHTTLVDTNGLVTVTGGKWTTYRVMAEDVMTECFEAGLLPVRAGFSGQHRLLGAPEANGAAPLGLSQTPGLHLYGSEAVKVLACPGAERQLGLGLSEAMVRHAVRAEHACTVEDVLARRSRALFLDARLAAQMAPTVAAILRDEGVSEPHLADFLSLCHHYLPPPDANKAV